MSGVLINRMRDRAILIRILYGFFLLGNKQYLEGKIFAVGSSCFPRLWGPGRGKFLLLQNLGQVSINSRGNLPLTFQDWSELAQFLWLVVQQLGQPG